MMSRFSVLGAALVAAVTLAIGAAACGDSSSTAGGAAAGGGSAAAGGNGTGNHGGDGSGGFILTFGGGGSGPSGFDVQPSALQTITVAIGQQTPTVAYQALLDGNPVSAGWGVDRGNIGTVGAGPSQTATFVPSGTTGGAVHVLAGLNNQTLQRSVFVKLEGTQNGYDPNNPLEQNQIATTLPGLTAGGGIGGVGGEGLGPAVSDPALVTALANPAGDGSVEGLRLIYPYDDTVFPRGLLAPLLQWRWTPGDADAIRIDLETTSGAFTWHGTFARPAILAQTGGAFIRHPIPQDIWQMATNSAGGADKLTMRLTVARAGVAYGPLSQTWSIAQARLSGIIYYNSYGTQLAKNYPGAVGGDHMFGGAVLSIHAGDTGPALTAGGNGGTNQCRVCHSVAANGSRLVVQHGDNYAASSAYDLTPNGSTEQALATGAEWPGMFPDGSLMLSGTGQLLPLLSGAPLPVTGLTSVTTSLGTPAIAPSGTRVVFNPMTGPLANAQQKLVVMDFDAVTNTFSNPVVVVDDTGQAAETRPGWAAFSPDGNSVIFHHQSVAGADGNTSGVLPTRKGAKAHIATTSTTAANVVPLNQLNGRDANNASYLPTQIPPVSLACTGDGVQVGTIDPDHGDDSNLNYEPTVNPVASGGYVWVVFTSRRMYGNVATIPPFCSDPRGVDLVQNITTKKLWVAAVDLTAPPGTDGSHPAFYLPGQELLAGNARGFWTLDPCKPDGDGCDAGDECCNGYCEPVGPNNSLVCSDTPPVGNCSQPQEICTTAADCCDPTNLCVNGFCAMVTPN